MDLLQLGNPVQGAKLYRYPAGSIVQLFGENPALYQATLHLNGHNGWDIVAPYDTPLLAACDGQVMATKYSPNLGGNEISILSTDGTVLVIYAHCDTILKQPKDMVKKGDIIATMGNSGFVVSGGVSYWGGSNPDKRGTHCHFGVHPADPSGTTGYPKNFSDANPNDINNPIPWKTVYFTKPDTNGFGGAVDPRPYFLQEIVNQGNGLLQRLIALLQKVGIKTP